MSRLLLGSLLSLTLFTGCATAYADRAAPVARPLVPIAVAPEAVRSPYSVEIISADGADLDTFFHGGRYYVHGSAGDRYIVRVTNPTAQRVEAVVSIDGLDVIDGEAGDLRKRGYVVPPYGSLDIEGWRTSLSDVSSFRFSSVGGSYAGKKGKARNVGVIAVALFAEQAPPEIIIDQPLYQGGVQLDDSGYGPEVERFLDRRPVPTAPGTRDNRVGAAKADADGRVAAAKRAPAPPPPPRTAAADEEWGNDAPSAGGGSYGPSTGSVTATAEATRPADALRYRGELDCCKDKAPAPERLGLGTEFGETRYSAANYTKFVRSSDRPVAVAELRYNDTAGLRALGILLDPTPDADEIMTRETADPFPGDRGFARPPAGIR